MPNTHLINPMRPAYAVVAYQTAWLKYYYPVEFMAALMTSVYGQYSTKVSEYTLHLPADGISQILPPDINEGEGGFLRMPDSAIRYGLSAIKGVGRPVIDDDHCRSVEADGAVFHVWRISCSTSESGREVNKRTIENFIKAGALDGAGRKPAVRR